MGQQTAQAKEVYWSITRHYIKYYSLALLANKGDDDMYRHPVLFAVQHC